MNEAKRASLSSEIKEQQVPLLVVAFNRPLFLEKLLLELKKLPIGEIYFSFDGPRTLNDVEQISKGIELVKSIAVERKVVVKSSKTNLGCCSNMISSLDWFYSSVKHGIVLEDDCLPSVKFLEFVNSKKHLIAQQYDFFMISGQNPLTLLKTEDFHHSAYPLIHGWYTTSEKWRRIRVDLLNTSRVRHSSLGRSRRKERVASFWHAAKLRVKYGGLDTWDCFLVDAMFKGNLKAIVPPEGLVKNIGNGQGTHKGNPYIEIQSPSSISKGNFDETLEKMFYRIRLRHVITPYIRVSLDFVRKLGLTVLRAFLDRQRH